VCCKIADVYAKFCNIEIYYKEFMVIFTDFHVRLLMVFQVTNTPVAFTHRWTNVGSMICMYVLALNNIKSGSRIHPTSIKGNLHVALSTVHPRIENICETHQP
jgi:hypothetical protein